MKLSIKKGTLKNWPFFYTLSKNNTFDEEAYREQKHNSYCPKKESTAQL